MKEAIATVSQHSQSSESLTDPHSDFGANEWLVDEMYDQYLEDKDSVDASWQRYFAAHPANGASAEANGGGTAKAPVVAPPAPAKAARPGSRPRPRPRPRPHPRAPAAGAPSRPASSAGQRQQPPAPAKAAPAPDFGDAHTSPLRGPAARVVANMEASLTVPTATSVRAVPAKLLIDNRIVINNHLAPQPRRQGLLHPPHRLRRSSRPSPRCPR